MFRRALLSLVSLSCFACHHPTDRKVFPVTPRELHTAYTIDDDTRYDGQLVRVYLPAGSYEVGAESILWREGRDTDAPDIRFAIQSPPTDTSRAVIVQGKVQGRLWDDGKRASGIPWCVHVECCHVTRQP